MQYQTAIAGAGAGSSQFGLNQARVPPPVGEPSMTQHLEFLRSCVRDVMELRRRMTLLAGNLRCYPESGSKAEAPPAPADLLGNFSSELGFLNVNICEMRISLDRIESSLFGCTTQTECAKER